MVCLKIGNKTPPVGLLKWVYLLLSLYETAANHEALATLNVVESLAERDPVYGEHLTAASLKLHEALPKVRR